jgi:hypothetical protein
MKTKTVNWDEFRCRCSAINRMQSTGADGRQITEKQEDDLKKLEDKEDRTDKQTAEMERLRALKARKGIVVLGDTCIEYLMEVFAWETEGMIPVTKESLDMMQMRKGKTVEVQSGQLLSFVDGVEYLQSKDRIFNDYLSGEIDFYLGENVYSATNVTDAKNANDYPGFLKKIHKGLEPGQREQMQGYGDITGARELVIANTLISFTPDMIMDMEFKVMRKLNCVTNESPEFLEEWKRFERSMVFDAIPAHKRVHKIKVDPFTDFEREKVYDRVKYCREFLWKFAEEHESRNK